MNFLRRANVKVIRQRPQVLLFYRNCLRVIKQLQPAHQKIWYDYTRLKFAENEGLKDEKVLEKRLKDGNEELEWVVSVLKRKKGGDGSKSANGSYSGAAMPVTGIE